MRERNGVRGLVEHLSRGKLRLVPVQIGARGFGHCGQDLFVTSGHQAHDLVPRADHRLAEIGICGEYIGIHHHQIDDFARNVGTVEQLGRVRVFEDRRDQRVPCHDRFHVISGKRRDHVGVGGVDDRIQIRFTETDRVKRARKKVVRHRQLDEVHRLAGQVFERSLAFHDYRVVAIGKVTDDQSGRVDTATCRDRQRVHVGGRHTIKGARRILVDGLDIVVDLNDLDVDPVFLGPFVHDPGLFEIPPWHPADIDGPGNAELGFLLGSDRSGQRKRQCGGSKCESATC